jgi:hypothetical protein
MKRTILLKGSIMTQVVRNNSETGWAGTSPEFYNGGLLGKLYVRAGIVS